VNCRVPSGTRVCGRALPGGCSSRRHSSEVQSSQRVIRAKTDAQTQLIAHLPSLADGWAYWGYGMDSMDKTATLLQVARVGLEGAEVCYD